jgi:hypothetical protein
MPYHLILAAAVHHQAVSNLQRQLGIHMTPNQGAVLIVVLIVAVIAAAFRAVTR